MAQTPADTTFDDMTNAVDETRTPRYRLIEFPEGDVNDYYCFIGVSMVVAHVNVSANWYNHRISCFEDSIRFMHKLIYLELTARKGLLRDMFYVGLNLRITITKLYRQDLAHLTKGRDILFL